MPRTTSAASTPKSIGNLGLEEIKLDEREDIWHITIGFSRLWDMQRGFAATQLGTPPIQSQSASLGFAAAIYPTTGLFAAAKALAAVYDDHVNDRPVSAPLYAFQDFVEMIGFQDIWDFETKYADLLKV